MTEKIEPMTAAELERIATQCERSQCQHAADYRRAAARIRELEAHARLGSLVAAIREHVALPLFPHLLVALGIGENRYDLDAQDLGFALSHLDSLLPKEPEVVTGPSGSKYRWDSGRVEVLFDGGMWRPASDFYIPITDAPVVAALLARQEGKANG